MFWLIVLLEDSEPVTETSLEIPLHPAQILNQSRTEPSPCFIVSAVLRTFYGFFYPLNAHFSKFWSHFVLLGRLLSVHFV